MKILAFSDLHMDMDAADAIVLAADQADLVIGAGDFANRREGLTAIMDRLAPIADKAIHVPGNNESLDELRSATAAHVLHGTSMVWQNIVVAGIGGAIPPLRRLPWSTYDLTEDDAAKMLSGVPRADILISHSPPLGYGDKHIMSGAMGAAAVRDAALRLSPQMLLCGHVHDDWGYRGWLGRTHVCNLGPTLNWFEV